MVSNLQQYISDISMNIWRYVTHTMTEKIMKLNETA